MPELNELAKKLGMNEYESRAFLALHREGASTPAALSKTAQIPRPRVYDVLSSLERKGHITSKPLRPVTYEPLPVADVIKNISRIKRKKLETELTELETIRSALENNLIRNKPRQKEDETVRLVQGRDAIYQKISRHLSNSKKEVIISTTAEGAKRKQEQFSSKLDKLKNKGVKVDLLSSEKNPRVAVFDNKQSILFITKDSSSGETEQALLLGSPQIAQFIASTLSYKKIEKKKK